MESFLARHLDRLLEVLQMAIASVDCVGRLLDMEARMKILKNSLALIGCAVVALYVLGALGLGNFRIYYGSDLPKEWCAKGQI
ncbi:MAG TPA: hypothetical protein VF447_00140 [Terriglobales bacterium]